MNGFLQTMGRLGPVRLAALAAVAAGMLGFFLYLGNRVAAPTYSVLYSELELKDSGQIVQKLEGMGVPYQLRGSGEAVLVPQDQVARIRMMMAEAGLPRGGSAGYAELFDKGESLGTSSFVQNVNHTRALEGELARTIAAIGAVQSARVHLVLPKREVFSRERQEASASVLLKLRGAERLGKGQVAAIRHLVASAVPSLKPANISITDAEGNLLARANGDDSASISGMSADEARLAYESRLSRNVEEMLERTLGPGKVRVEARADMDFDRITTSSESFDPDGQVVRSTQSVSEQNDQSESSEQSVTVANNLPDAQRGTGGAGGARTKGARTEETTNYEVSKKVVNHVREAGVVRRLSVAVLVDGVWSAAQDGQRQWQPRSPEELQQMTALVRSAIGFDEKRGDRVEVVNLRFAAAEDMPAAEAPFNLLGFGKADLFRMVEGLAFALIGVLVMLLVVKPFLNRLAGAVPAAEPAGTAGLLTDQSGGAAAALPGPAGSVVPLTPAGNLAEEAMIDLSRVEGRVKASSIKKIGEIVEKHPEETVAILRSWMYQES